MRELAMGTVDIAPLLEQLEDRGHLLGSETVQRRARLAVIQTTLAAPAAPPPRPPLVQLEVLAGAAVLPALSDGTIDQPEQLMLGGRVDPARDPATQSQRSFPPPASTERPSPSTPPTTGRSPPSRPRVPDPDRPGEHPASTPTAHPALPPSRPSEASRSSNDRPQPDRPPPPSKAPRATAPARSHTSAKARETASAPPLPPQTSRLGHQDPPADRAGSLADVG